MLITALINWPIDGTPPKSVPALFFNGQIRNVIAKDFEYKSDLVSTSHIIYTTQLN